MATNGHPRKLSKVEETDKAIRKLEQEKAREQHLQDLCVPERNLRLPSCGKCEILKKSEKAIASHAIIHCEHINKSVRGQVEDRFDQAYNIAKLSARKSAKEATNARLSSLCIPHRDPASPPCRQCQLHNQQLRKSVAKRSTEHAILQCPHVAKKGKNQVKTYYNRLRHLAEDSAGPPLKRADTPAKQSQTIAANTRFAEDTIHNNSTDGKDEDGADLLDQLEKALYG